jgi:hypothetical protein
MMNLKRSGRRKFISNLKYCPGICLQGLTKTAESPRQKFGLADVLFTVN